MPKDSSDSSYFSLFLLVPTPRDTWPSIPEAFEDSSV